MALGTMNMFGSTEDEVKKKQKQYAKTVPKRVTEGVNAFKQRQQGFEGNKEGNAGANLGGTAYTADQEFRDRPIEDRSTRVGPINVIKNTQEEKDRIAAGAAKYDARIAAEKAMLKEARSKPRQISEYEKELEARNRKMMYNQILGNAGTKGKAISMRSALAMINQMEGNRIKEEGMAMEAQQAAAQLGASQAEAASAAKAKEVAAQLSADTDAADRASREKIASDKLAIEESKLGLLEDKFMEETRQAGIKEEAASAAATFEKRLAKDKSSREQLELMLESLKLADPQKIGLSEEHEAILGGILDTLLQNQEK